jgi:hypothetical protein
VTIDFGAELATPPDSCGAPRDADRTIAAVPAAVATAVVADPGHAEPAIEVTTDFGVAPGGGSGAAAISVGERLCGAS